MDSFMSDLGIASFTASSSSSSATVSHLSACNGSAPNSKNSPAKTSTSVRILLNRLFKPKFYYALQGSFGKSRGSGPWNGNVTREFRVFKPSRHVELVATKSATNPFVSVALMEFGNKHDDQSFGLEVPWGQNNNSWPWENFCSHHWPWHFGSPMLTTFGWSSSQQCSFEDVASLDLILGLMFSCPIGLQYESCSSISLYVYMCLNIHCGP